MSYSILIEPLGVTIACEEGQSLLEAITAHSLNVPHGCKKGACSSCKATVREGNYKLREYSPFALMDFEREENVVLLCRTFPQGDLVIESEDITTSGKNEK